MDMTPQQILDKSFDHTLEDYRKWSDELRFLSYAVRDRALESGSDPDPDDLSKMGELNDKIWGSPYVQPTEVLMGLRGQGSASLQLYVQEKIWELLWWADYRGEDVIEYVSVGIKNMDIWGPNTLKAVRTADQMPEGWLPESRR